MATRESIFEDYREAIQEGMARALWLYAYADWVEELTEEERDELGVDRARGGKDWDDVAPATPKAADKAAKELIKLYESGKANGPDIVELYGMAQTVDMEEDFEFTSDNAMPLIKSDTKEHAERTDHYWKIKEAELFGSRLASMALGHGVSWFDDHKTFKLDRPNFECHYDGEDLTWSGGTSDVREVSGKLGRITVVNHNDASWTKHSYVLAFGGFTIAALHYLLIYANSLQDAIDEMIDWVVDNEPDSLADEQVNEQYNELVAEGVDENDAQEQAQADTISGGNAGNYIHSEDWHIVAEDPTEEALQSVKYENPGEKCSTEYHKTLKADDAKWQTLELKGHQRHEADEFGPAEVIELRDCDRCPSTLGKKIEGNPRQRSRWTVDVMEHDGRILQTQIFASEENARKYASKVARPDLRIDVHPTGQRNPAGLTAKGERMYEDIKRSYQRRGDPRAKEIASRTVLARAKDVPGLKSNAGPGPGVWTIVRKDNRDVYWADPQIARELGLRSGWYDFYSHYTYNAEYDQPIALPPDGKWVKSTRGTIDQNRARQTRSVKALREGGYVENPTQAGHMKQRKHAEAVLAKRKAAGFEGGCDDPNCRGWDVFEQDNDPLHGGGIGVQACDMCNAEAKRQGLPVLHDSDAKHLAAAEKALQRARREAQGA